MPLTLLALILALFASPAFAAPDAASAWTDLSSLAGNWKRADAKTPEQQAFRIQYKFISANTALVEVFGNPARQVTETIYHRDGERLMVTHYCAQGNQPRLKLRDGTPTGTLQFDFLDVTNLKRPGASHLVRIRFERADATHLVRKETYEEDGKEQETILSLERVGD